MNEEMYNIEELSDQQLINDIESIQQQGEEFAQQAWNHLGSSKNLIEDSSILSFLYELKVHNWDLTFEEVEVEILDWYQDVKDDLVIGYYINSNSKIQAK